MEQLSALKQKIQLIVSQNISLKEHIKALEARNSELSQKVSDLGLKLEQKTSFAASFVSQKDALSETITELLASIDTVSSEVVDE